MSSSIVGIKKTNEMYTCSMHPEINHVGSGVCPICGMRLIPVSPETSEEESLKYIRHLSIKFWVGVILTLLILGVDYLPFAMKEEIRNIISLILVLPVMFWVGWAFHRTTWITLRRFNLNMYTLVTLGTSIGFTYSTIATFFPQIFPFAFLYQGAVPVYFSGVSIIITFILLGEILQEKANNKTAESLKSLLDLAPNFVDKQEKDGTIKSIPLVDVKLGDILRVKPGSNIPADGVVISGVSLVNNANITGESIPIKISQGSKVLAGTTNHTGVFFFRVNKSGKDSLLGKIVSVVSEARRTTSSVQSLVDKVASIFVPVVIAIAIITFLVWMFFGPEPRFIFALISAISVLIIACPCALGLASPISITVGMGQGAKHGILFRNASALEALKNVNVLITDKTGTLTLGKPHVTDVCLSDDSMNRQNALSIAASLETLSEHPVAYAIVESAKDQKIPLKEVHDFKSVPGYGIEGVIDGKKVFLGRVQYLENNGISAMSMQSVIQQLRSQSKSIVCVAYDGQFIAIIAVTDPIRKSAARLIKILRHWGVMVVMATGDNQITAHTVGSALGIKEVYSGYDPLAKAELVKRFQVKGYKVAMLGDGTNDAPGLAVADVGIAVASGTDIAKENAGITLMSNNLRGVIRAMKLSRAVIRNIKQNLFFSFFYNVVGILIAAGVLYPAFGFVLNPAIAGIAMSFSSISVVTNALRLMHKKI